MCIHICVCIYVYIKIASISTPLLFYGVQGRDMSEDDSPSFYNPVEAAAGRTCIYTYLYTHTYLYTYLSMYIER